MKHLNTLILTFLLTLAACQIPSEQLAMTAGNAAAIAHSIDRDQNGSLSSSEIKQAGGNIDVWTQIALGVLGLFGSGAAAAAYSKASAAHTTAAIAHNSAEKAQTDVDALYDSKKA